MKLRITSKRDGRRRAGMAHPDRPVEHDASRFTETQIAQLKSDPQLIVEPVEHTSKPDVGKTSKGQSGQSKE